MTTSTVSPAQKIAAKLLEKIRMCSAGDMDKNGMDVFSIFGHPEFDRTENGFDTSHLDDDQKDELFDKYCEQYESICLATHPDEGIPDKLRYIHAKLTGIVEGHITSGDGDLGRDLNELASRMSDVAQEKRMELFQQRENKETYLCMKPELVDLHVKFFGDMQQLVLHGAEQGLFTSGHSIAPIREKSIAEKYAGARESHLKTKGLA